jgi:hypothetical protein
MDMPVKLTKKQLAQMKEYNLDDVRDIDTHELYGFICLNCGMRYPTIAERMKKSPEECEGCFYKAKWG